MSGDRIAAESRGVQLAYVDTSGTTRTPSDETIEAVLEAMGPLAEHRADPLFVRTGDRWRIEGLAAVHTEDGRSIAVAGELPDLANGYHDIEFSDGERRRLIVSPGECHLPAGLKRWGWAAQLYAARSRRSWGIGDLDDLAELGRWSRELGAGMILLNPLHAPAPTTPVQPSPYFASSRRFRNPLYLRIENVQGAAALGSRLQPLAEAARGLLANRRIDYDRVFDLKMHALDELWRAFPGDDSFTAFCSEPGIESYAAFCVISEQHGRPWAQWPPGLRHPGSESVQQFIDANRDRIHFHMWLQWLVGRQLAAVAVDLPLVNDLAIGADPDGADAWLWQDTLARGIEVGAPPDDFNTQGQKWGFPPFDPAKLRAAGYEPFIQTLRSVFTHSAGIRIDHVLGLFRLFWIPVGSPATEGVYVRYPASDLLDIVALESERAGSFVVGEDLGTVEPGVREQLGERKLLSYRVFWFEDVPPAEYPERSLAAVTTHDLPTVTGLWNGSDVELQAKLGLEPNQESNNAARSRLETFAGINEEMPIEEVVERAYGALGDAPSALLAATLDDALCVEERPNLPGTTDEQWPDWSLALPDPLEELFRRDLPRRIASTLGRRERG